MPSEAPKAVVGAEQVGPVVLGLTLSELEAAVSFLGEKEALWCTHAIACGVPDPLALVRRLCSAYREALARMALETPGLAPSVPTDELAPDRSVHDWADREPRMSLEPDGVEAEPAGFQAAAAPKQKAPLSKLERLAMLRRIEAERLR